MAWTQERQGSFRILFRHGGKQHAFTVGRVSAEEAEAKVAHVDYLLMRLRQGLVEIPPGADVVSFVEHDGRLPLAVKASARRDSADLGQLRERYVATHIGSQEDKTLYTTGIHFKHLVSNLGESCVLSDITHAILQKYVDQRGAKGIKPVTIKKELATLRAAWNWGKRNDLVTGDWMGRDLVYKKISEKPPFQTRVEVERQIVAGGLTTEQKRILWGALYLQKSEVEEALEVVLKRDTHPWVYPMACTAAYTGARRSELARMRIGDVDFAGGSITIQEKKRVRGKLTTRRVPLSAALASVLQDYLKSYKGKSYLFCHSAPSNAGRQVSPKDAHDYLRRALAKSRWSVIKGWHVFRHSFIGICASSGIDQRFIDEWVGHQTDEQRRRYRHLAPDAQKRALGEAFD